MSGEVQLVGKIYTTKQTAEILGIEEHVLRYMSEQLGDILDVGRDEQLNREYSNDDIEMLKKVNKIRDTGVMLLASTFGEISANYFTEFLPVHFFHLVPKI